MRYSCRALVIFLNCKANKDYLFVRLFIEINFHNLPVSYLTAARISLTIDVAIKSFISFLLNILDFSSSDVVDDATSFNRPDTS